MPTSLSNPIPMRPPTIRPLRRPFARVLAAALTGAVLLSTPARAATPTTVDNSQIVQALHYLGQLNRADPMEPAGSHGSLGIAASAGAQALTPPVAANPVLKSQLGTAVGGDQGAAPANPYSMARVWLLKGSPLPLDFGLTAGRPVDIDGANVTQIGAHVQWTVYEALAMPAVAIRAMGSRLTGIADTSLTTFGGTAVASYSFLRIFAVYGEVGLLRHQGSMTLRDPGGLALSLRNADDATTQINESWSEPVRSVGVRVAVVPPFVSLTVGASQGLDGVREYGAKLSIGM